MMATVTNATNLRTSDSILDDLDALHAKRSLPAVIYTATLMVPGLLGNVLTIYIYLRILTKPSTKRLFVIALAVVDFLACAILMPTGIAVFFIPYEFTSDFVCKLMRTTFYYIPLASVLTLLLISLERYRKICCPLKWQITRRMAMRYLCIASVGVALVLSIPATVMHGATRLPTEVENVTGVGCHVTYTFRHTVYPTIYSVTLLVTALISLIYLLVCYGYIYRECRRHVHFDAVTISTVALKHYTGTHQETSTGTSSKSSSVNGGFARHGGHDVSMLKVTRMLFVVTAVFIVSFLPHSFLELLITLKSGFVSSLNDAQFAVYEIALRSYMVHHMANPIIYGLLDDVYRHACKRLLTGVCHRHRHARHRRRAQEQQ